LDVNLNGGLSRSCETLRWAGFLSVQYCTFEFGTKHTPAFVLPPAFRLFDIKQNQIRSLLAHERQDLLCMLAIIFHKIDAVWRRRGAYTLAFERSQAAID
jgi:hypothetical protein